MPASAKVVGDVRWVTLALAIAAVGVMIYGAFKLKGGDSAPIPCDHSSDCPLSEPICDGHFCRKCKPNECPAGTKCVDGKCNPGACAEDADCPEPEVCKSGQCVSPCPPCNDPAKPVCDPPSKMCVPCDKKHPCPPDKACESVGPETGKCVPPRNCPNPGSVDNPATNTCVCRAGWTTLGNGTCKPPIAAGALNCQDAPGKVTDMTANPNNTPTTPEAQKLYQCTGVAGVEPMLSGTTSPTAPWALDQVYLDHYDDPKLKPLTFPGNTDPGVFDAKKVSLTNASGCYFPKQEAPDAGDFNCSRGLRLTPLWIGSGTAPDVSPPYESRDIGDWQKVGDTFYAHHKIWGKGGAGQWMSNGAHTANIYPRLSGPDGSGKADAIRLRCVGDLWGMAAGSKPGDVPKSSDGVPLTPGLYQVQSKHPTSCKADASVTALDGGCGGSKWECKSGVCKKSKIPDSCAGPIGVENATKQQPTCWTGSTEYGQNGTGGSDSCLIGTRCDGFKERVYVAPPAAAGAAIAATAATPPAPPTPASPPAPPPWEPTNPPFDPEVAWNPGATAASPNPTGKLTEAERRVFARCGGCVVTQDIWGPGRYTFEMKVPPTPHAYDGSPNETLTNPNVNIDKNCLSGYVFAIWLFTETEMYTIFEPYDPTAPPASYPSHKISGDKTTIPPPPAPYAGTDGPELLGSGVTQLASQDTALIETPEAEDTVGMATIGAAAKKHPICDIDCGDEGGYYISQCACPSPPRNDFACGDAYPGNDNVCRCYPECGRGPDDRSGFYPCAFPFSDLPEGADCHGIANGPPDPPPVPWWPSDQAMWSGRTTNACEGNDFKLEPPGYRDLDGEVAGSVKVQNSDQQPMSFFKPHVAATTRPLTNWQGVLGRSKPTCVPNNGQMAGGGGQGSSTGGQSQEEGGAFTYRALGCVDPTCKTDDDCNWSSPTIPSTSGKPSTKGKPTFTCQTTKGGKKYCLPDKTNSADLYTELAALYAEDPTTIANNCLSFQQQWQTGLLGAKWCGNKRSLSKDPCVPNMNEARWHRSGDQAVVGAKNPTGVVDPEIPYFVQSAELGGDIQSHVWGGDNVFGVLNHEIDFEIPCNTPTTPLNANRANGAWGPETINLNTWLADNNSYTPTGETPWYTQAMATYNWGDATESPTLQGAWPEGGIDKATCESVFRGQRSFMSKKDLTGTKDWGQPDAYTTIVYEIDWWADEDPTQSYVTFRVGDSKDTLVDVYTTSRFVPTRGGRWIIGPWPARWGGGYRPHIGKPGSMQSNSQAWDYVYCDLLSASFRPYTSTFVPAGLSASCAKLRAVGNTYDQQLQGISEGTINNDSLVVKRTSRSDPDMAYAAMTCTPKARAPAGRHARDRPGPRGSSGYDCEIRCGIRQLVDWSSSTMSKLFPEATYDAGKSPEYAACTQRTIKRYLCPDGPNDSSSGAAVRVKLATSDPPDPHPNPPWAPWNVGATVPGSSGSSGSSSKSGGSGSNKLWFEVAIGTACAASVLIGVTIWLWLWVKKLKKRTGATAPTGPATQTVAAAGAAALTVANPKVAQTAKPAQVKPAQVGLFS